MRLRLVLALVLYALGLARTVDWFIFQEMNNHLAHDPHTLHEKYLERFPGWLQPLFTGKPEPVAIISVILFTVAGLMLLGEEQLWPKAIALTCFIFAFWSLFAMM